MARELAERTVRVEVNAEVERAAAAALAGKLRRRSGMTPELLEAALARRGFHRGLIRELLEE